MCNIAVSYTHLDVYKRQELTALNKKLDTTVSAREVLDIIVKADYIESQLKPNKDLLQDLINKANGLNRASYTACLLYTSLRVIISLMQLIMGQ